MFGRAQVDVLQGSARSHIGPIGKTGVSIARLTKTKCRSEGKTALQIHDRVELPSAHELVRNTVDAAEEGLSLPKRQLVHGIQAEPMPDVKSGQAVIPDRKSTRLNSSHLVISYAVFC